MYKNIKNIFNARRYLNAIIEKFQSIFPSSEDALLEKSLKEAIKKNHMYLVYQPKVELETGKVVGVEALARWKTYGNVYIAPKDFIPRAESTGLIVPLGRWALKAACKQIRKWEVKGVKGFSVAINVSPIQLEKDKHFLSELYHALRDSKVGFGRMEFEITEGAILKHPESIKQFLKDLSVLGVKVSLDDFGTGYSSLSVLNTFNFNAVKIDQAFIANIPDDSRSAAMVTAIIDMAAALNLKVVAEGVETEEQREFLLKRGCHEGQGYLFGPPVIEDLLPELIERIETQFGV